MPLSDPRKTRMPRPKLVIFFGMTASGKSTLALAWAQQQGCPYYNTDRIRKELAGLQATDRRPDGIEQGIYSPALSALTYQTMLDRAAQDLAGGAFVVVLDGAYSKWSDRETVREAATAAGADCLFCYCYCSEAETKRRLAARAVDKEAVSDGRWEIYLYQQANFVLPEGAELEDCFRLSTEDTVSELIKKITAQSSSRD
ncbi:MAG: AAA family ATPase [Desulfobulbus sp.]|nr:AAA family ATPase [Desulfobulbus sp.]